MKKLLIIITLALTAVLSGNAFAAKQKKNKRGQSRFKFSDK